jgi:hypothetical protein
MHLRVDGQHVLVSHSLVGGAPVEARAFNRGKSALSQNLIAPTYASGTTAIASISNKAPSRASFDICTAVEAGGALVFT